MEFKLANEKNANEIYNIIKLCADDMALRGLMHWIPYYPKEKILEDIRNKKVYIVKDNNENVATFMLADDVEYKQVYLSKLAVKPYVSGKGIGTKCINFIEEYCKKNLLNKIVIDVYDKSKSAINFYEKNNFKKVGEKNTSRFVVYIMEKELT